MRSLYLSVVMLGASLSTVYGAPKATRPAFRVVQTGVVYEAEQDSGQPGIVRAADGTLLVAFYSGSNILTSRSTDNGTSWQHAQVVALGAATEVGIARLKDGTLLWPFYQQFIKMPCCQIRHFDTYVYRSRDNGHTWQGDEPLNLTMREPIPYGRILELADGRLLMPVWGSAKRGERWQAGTFESRDSGRTWGNYTQIGYDPKAGCRPDNGFTETSLAQLSGDLLIAILRQQRVGSTGGPCDVYTEPTNVHFYRAVSHDHGKSWSKPEELSLIGTSPALFVTKRGTLVLAYRDSPEKGTDTTTEHYGLSVRISRDQGVTWTNEVHLQDPKGLKYSKSAQPGYPDLADLPDGRLLVVFHSVMTASKTEHQETSSGSKPKQVLYIAYNILQPEDQ